ncbi:RabGAP/TBC [Sparassis latifolia]
MDFEMVRPGIPQSPLAENSADSLPLPSLLQERANSTSGELPAPPPPSPHAVMRTSYVDQAPPESRPHKVMDAADIEAHRQRELRWISTMSSVSPSQARKSKKVRKMVLEGVPASVRYLVWAHLTDSKAKRMEGLYTRLLQREKVAASADIERDVRQLSVHLPVMHDDSLMNVLQAYLSMVPDIQYSRGLCSIASQLLLLSPEEDAFWTFISLMDTHLRPYFSSNAIQLDVDAALFGKAVEANDSALAKKIFLDMAVSPISVCRPWFTSLFVGALSPEYFHRVWDVFLFEGVPFLFRIGIALLTCCRQLLLKCAGHDPLFAILSHPPANYLPRTPDALIDLALSVKLKDEDIRKQRSKLEAQVKRQTQSRVLSSALPAGISVPAISLPRS